MAMQLLQVIFGKKYVKEDIVQQLLQSNNLVENSLSCTFDDHVCLSTISISIPNWLQSVKKGYVNDSSLSEIIQRLGNNPSIVSHYSWDGASQRYKGHLVIPHTKYIQ